MLCRTQKLCSSEGCYPSTQHDQDNSQASYQKHSSAIQSLLGNSNTVSWTNQHGMQRRCHKEYWFGENIFTAEASQRLCCFSWFFHMAKKIARNILFAVVLASGYQRGLQYYCWTSYTCVNRHSSCKSSYSMTLIPKNWSPWKQNRNYFNIKVMQ